MVGRVMTGQMVAALRALGFDEVFDTSFGADLTVLMEAEELIERMSGRGGPLPMFSSCCPAWVKYVRDHRPDLLPHVSTCKSPHMMLGAAAKSFYARAAQIDPESVFVVSIMPCTAKKREAMEAGARGAGGRMGLDPEPGSISSSQCRSPAAPGVDAVLTTREFARMVRWAGIDIATLPPAEFGSMLGRSTGGANLFGGAGGVAEAIMRSVESRMRAGGPEAPSRLPRVASVQGLREAARLLDALTCGDGGKGVVTGPGGAMPEGCPNIRELDFVEVMACPGGCVGGGGQPIVAPGEPERAEARFRGLREIDTRSSAKVSDENADAARILAELGGPASEPARLLFHVRRRLDRSGEAI
jgi:iron only hydrogenase large subunit-like protein